MMSGRRIVRSWRMILRLYSVTMKIVMVGLLVVISRSRMIAWLVFRFWRRGWWRRRLLIHILILYNDLRRLAVLILILIDDLLIVIIAKVVLVLIVLKQEGILVKVNNCRVI